MSKKIISFFVILLMIFGQLSMVKAGEEREDDYKELRSINLGTFNEYGYKITEQFFRLREKFEVDGLIDQTILKSIESLANTSYNYLPDNLNNKKMLDTLKIALQRGSKYKNSEAIYTEIVKAIENYLYNSEIKKITGSIEASPSVGNAPLNTTLRARITDPTGTIIPSYNYIWWVDDAGKRKIVGRGLSINYTFNEEGKFSIFLDVLSDHRNSKGYIDVLPFRSRADVEVKQKVANLIIKVQNKNLRSQDNLKFTPEEATYGIMFDATSSTPTSGTKFLKTSWDFGNGVKREYDGAPKVERVTYGGEGEYTVKLILKTNELQEVERKFTVSIHKPIATIESTQEQGFMGDRFTFSANPGVLEKNLTYSWEIVDIDRDDTILKKSGNVFTYEFTKKGKFNVKLKVTEPSGEVDNDNKIIYINSRAPVADFSSSTPKANKPNRILFDATKSFDQDYTDDGKLEYSWEIDGQKVELENPNFNGAFGFYTFDSAGDHSVVLEVTDPDGIKSQKKQKVTVNSVLAVDFSANPLVIHRNSFIKFISESPEARFFKWDFGDGSSAGGSEDKTTHYFDKSGTFQVNLEVTDSEGNINNVTKTVYVGDSEYPYSMVSIGYDNGFDIPYDSSACGGKGAYVSDRISTVKFNGMDSINVDGQKSGLLYSWKVGLDKFSSSPSFTQKMGEMGCFPVKLTVKSEKNGKSHTSETNIEIRNLKPILTSLSIQPVDINTDPVIVNVDAIGAKDKDGVIQSYTWYYYSDGDNEPQDYRSTSKPTTTFVLPKISGTYYFVAILKDNNEEKLSTEDLSSKYFLSLTGDNSNTPLVDFTVNDSSISVGDEVIFSAKVKNIIGQDLTDKALYSWDFDGDGFYDKEVTGKGNVSYKFSKSGTYRVKVKVKYKGISNTKNVTINVVNELTPDFDYIAIGNKVVFFNKSAGKYDTITWDLGDGNIKEGSDNLVYTYTDGEKKHNVNLKITDGTKLKETTKEVTANPKNILKVSKDGLNILSNQEITDEGKINLKEESERVFVYLGSSKGDYRKYSIDYDTSYDTDLNGGKDDDEDNKDTPSYSTGDPIEIKLSENKNQTFRIVLKDSKGKIVSQKDIEIIKEYVKVEETQTKDVEFKGITSAEKEKIDLLKSYINDLPANYAPNGKKYLEKLQGEWFDSNEKTKVIIEFENFLDNPEIKNSSEIIDLLESILVEGQADKSQKNIAYSALKNLLRDDIACSFDKKEFDNCKNYLVDKLEQIKNSSDTEKNKITAKDILKAILDDKVMSDKEKTDFKEILKSLIYGTAASEVTSNEAISTTQTSNTGFISSTFTFIKSIAWIIFSIIAVVFLVIIGYWLYFKIANKDKNKGFEEFIIEKTSNEEDILNELGNSKNDLDSLPIIDNPINHEKKEENNVNNNSDILGANLNKTQEDNNGVPDWLKGTFEQASSQQKVQDNKLAATITTDNLHEDTEIINPLKSIEPLIENKVESETPDWLKSNYSYDLGSSNDENSPTNNVLVENTNENIITSSVSENTNEINEENSSIQLNEISDNIEENKESSTNDNLVVPDWLKGSLEDGEKKKYEISDKKEKVKTKEKIKDKKEEVSLDDITKIEENSIPDWLKGSLEEGEKKKESKVSKKTKDDKKVSTTSKDDKKTNELWQDGMQVPDWLNDVAKDDDSSTKNT